MHETQQVIKSISLSVHVHLNNVCVTQTCLYSSMNNGLQQLSMSWMEVIPIYSWY